MLHPTHKQHYRYTFHAYYNWVLCPYSVHYKYKAIAFRQAHMYSVGLLVVDRIHSAFIWLSERRPSLRAKISSKTCSQVEWSIVSVWCTHSMVMLTCGKAFNSIGHCYLLPTKSGEFNTIESISRTHNNPGIVTCCRRKKARPNEHSSDTITIFNANWFNCDSRLDANQ